MGILGILNILAPFIPNADQRQKAAQAIQDSYVQFLVATENAWYAIVRVLLILASIYDLIFNGAAAAKQAGLNAAGNPVALVELLIMLWPFFGPAVMAVGPQVIQAVLQIAQKSAHAAPPASPVTDPVTADQEAGGSLR